MSVDVVAVGWSCPLGLVSRPIYAAIRAGLRGIDMLEDDDDRLVCRLELPEDDPRDPGRSRAERAAFFAAYALRELGAAGPWPSSTAAWLAGSEPGPAGDLDVAAIWAWLSGELAREHGLTLPRATQIFPSGRAGVFEALSAAREQLERDAIEFALVGGFDSMVDAETLARLAAAESPVLRRSDDRSIPGEAAAFLLLARAGTRTHALARLAELTLTRDPQPFCHGGPSRGAGLTESFAELRRRVSGRVDILYPGTPARGWWARELSYAYLRNAALMPEPLTVTCIHEHLGDLGAATGAAALVTAVRGLTPLLPGRLPEHRRALVYACSNAGTIGACLLTPPSDAHE
jgi:3-oxoacyl-[acyl-carrier-protein] synthase I